MFRTPVGAIPSSIPHAVNIFGQTQFLAVNHFNACSRHLLNHFLARGGAYILNRDSLHGQTFVHASICLTTGQNPARDSVLSVTLPKPAAPLKMVQLLYTHVWHLLHALQLHTSAHELDLLVMVSNHSTSIVG